MLKKNILILVGILLAVLVPAGVFAAANWHCCIEPSCMECTEDLLGCNCDLREKLGMEVCSECSAAGCGLHKEIKEETPACH